MKVTPDGEKIKQLRNERAWPQTQLATVANKDVRTIQRIEAGHRVSHDTLMGIAGALDVAVKEILRPDAPTDAERASAPSVEALPRITSGKELLQLVTGAHAFEFDHEDVEDGAVATEVGELLQNLREYIDIGADLTIPQKIEAGLEISQAVERLADLGYWVFGRSSRRKCAFTSAGEKQTIPLLVATVIVLSSRNPAVVSSSPIPHAPSTSARLRILQGSGGH